MAWPRVKACSGSSSWYGYTVYFCEPGALWRTAEASHPSSRNSVLSFFSFMWLDLKDLGGSHLWLRSGIAGRGPMSHLQAGFLKPQLQMKFRGLDNIFLKDCCTKIGYAFVYVCVTSISLNVIIKRPVWTEKKKKAQSKLWELCFIPWTKLRN